MIISDFAIRRPLITVVAMVAMVIFGIFALMKLKTDEFPGRGAAVAHGRHHLSRRVAGSASRSEVLNPSKSRSARSPA